MAMDRRRVGAFIVLALLVLTLSAGVVMAVEPTPHRGQWTLPPLPPDFVKVWIPAMFMFLGLFVVLLIVSKLVPFIPQDKIGWIERILFSLIFAAGAVFYAYAFPENAWVVQGWNTLFSGLGGGTAILLAFLAVIAFIGAVVFSLRGAYKYILPIPASWKAKLAQKLAQKAGVEASQETEQILAEKELLKKQKGELELLKGEVGQELNMGATESQAIGKLQMVLDKARMLTNGQPFMVQRANQFLAQATSYLPYLSGFGNTMRQLLLNIKEKTSALSAGEESELMKLASVRAIAAQLKTNLKEFYALDSEARSAPIKDAQLNAFITRLIGNFNTRRAQLANLKQYETELGQFITQYGSEIQNLHGALIGGLPQLAAANTHLATLRNIVNRQQAVATEVELIDNTMIQEIQTAMGEANMAETDAQQLYTMLKPVAKVRAAASVAATPAGGTPSA